MKTTRLLSLIARGMAFVLVLGMAAAASAQGPGGGGGQGPRGMGLGGPGGPPMMGGGSALRLVMQLNLSDEQRTKIRELVETQRKASQTQQQEMRQLQQQLVAAIFGGATDNGGPEQIVANLAKLQAEQLQADVTLQQSIVPILTAEQCQQLVQLANRQGPPPPPPGQ